MMGLYQYAEALYNLGEFEEALIVYHRGHRLRPEMEGFRIGIQKCQEAIEKCIGSKILSETHFVFDSHGYNMNVESM